MAGVLGKSSHPQLMSFYQSMLSLPKLASTCALWSTGKSQGGLFDGKSPSLSAQANPVSLDGAQNLMRLLCLQFHSQVLPGQEYPRTKKNPIEKHWVMSQDGGGAWYLQQTRGQGKKRPKKYMSLCISPRMAAYDCGVGAK